MPRTADDGDALQTLGLRRADGAAHPCFAEGLVLIRRSRGRRGCRRGLARLAQLGHGLPDRGKHADVAGAVVLDDVLPPPLAVVEPGGAGELAEWIVVHGAR